MNRSICVSLPHRPRLAVILGLFLFSGACAAAAPAHAAAGGSPQQLLESVKTEMLRELEKPEVRADTDRVNDLVERVLLPHIDMLTASRLVLGQHWKSLDSNQRQSFTHEFRRYLVRFYTEALAGYVRTNDIPADFMTIEPGRALEGTSQVLIETRIVQPNRDSIPVVYRLLHSDAWRVIDITLNGISLAKLYRGQFASVVKRDGIDALIAQLRERNASLETQ